jgi:tetratricopeptide (TPR) repeat protein
VTADTTDTEAKETKRLRGRWRRWLFQVARLTLVLAITGGIIWGIVWWRERPLREAEAALADNDAKYADFLLSEFLQSHPNHSGALALKARSLVKLGDSEQAGQIFDKIGTANAADTHAWAQALLMEQMWSAAVPLLNQVIRLEPRNADALHELTVAHSRLGQLDKALSNAQRMARLPGLEARGNVLVGTILGDMKNYAAAAEAFEAVLRHDPKAETLQITADQFFLQYGRILLELGKPDKALMPLRQSVAVREAGEAFALLGDAALQIGEPAKAKSAWVKAIQVEPLNRQAREALADLALQQNDPKAALEWLKPLENYEPLESSTSYLFQRTYVALGDLATADRWKQQTDIIREQEKRRRVLDLLLVESPNSFWARFIRAHRFATNGNWGEAEMLADLLIKESPADPLVIELVDAIRRKATLPSLDRVPIEQH